MYLQEFKTWNYPSCKKVCHCLVCLSQCSLYQPKHIAVKNLSYPNLPCDRHIMHLPYASDSAAGALNSDSRAATSSQETVTPWTTPNKVSGVCVTESLGFSITTFCDYGIPSNLCHLISMQKSSNLFYYSSLGNHSELLSIHATQLHTLHPLWCRGTGSCILFQRRLPWSLSHTGRTNLPAEVSMNEHWTDTFLSLRISFLHGNSQLKGYHSINILRAVTFPCVPLYAYVYWMYCCHFFFLHHSVLCDPL